MMSSMELKETLDHPADPDTVFAMLCDQSWREEVCRRTHATDYTVVVEQRGDSVVVRTTRVVPAPDAAKKFVGASLTIEQNETWGIASADGSRSADLEIAIKGQPAGMRGTRTLAPGGSGSVETVSGDVKVRIPFVGAKFEPTIADAIRAAIHTEGKAGREYLAG
jgi:hypothetical protein